MEGQVCIQTGDPGDLLYYAALFLNPAQKGEEPDEDPCRQDRKYPWSGPAGPPSDQRGECRGQEAEKYRVAHSAAPVRTAPLPERARSVPAGTRAGFGLLLCAERIHEFEEVKVTLGVGEVAVHEAAHIHGGCAVHSQDRGRVLVGKVNDLTVFAFFKAGCDPFSFKVQFLRQAHEVGCRVAQAAPRLLVLEQGVVVGPEAFLSVHCSHALAGLGGQACIGVHRLEGHVMELETHVTSAQEFLLDQGEDLLSKPRTCGALEVTELANYVACVFRPDRVRCFEEDVFRYFGELQVKLKFDRLLVTLRTQTQRKLLHPHIRLASGQGGNLCSILRQEVCDRFGNALAVTTRLTDKPGNVGDVLLRELRLSLYRVEEPASLLELEVNAVTDDVGA